MSSTNSYQTDNPATETEKLEKTTKGMGVDAEAMLEFALGSDAIPPQEVIDSVINESRHTQSIPDTTDEDEEDDDTSSEEHSTPPPPCPSCYAKLGLQAPETRDTLSEAHSDSDLSDTITMQEISKSLEHVGVTHPMPTQPKSPTVSTSASLSTDTEESEDMEDEAQKDNTTAAQRKQQNAASAGIADVTSAPHDDMPPLPDNLQLDILRAATEKMFKFYAQSRRRESFRYHQTVQMLSAMTDVRSFVRGLQIYFLDRKKKPMQIANYAYAVLRHLSESIETVRK
eukprot:3934289-Rhodomonas_salina.2